MQRALRGSEPHPDLAEVLNDMGLLLYEKGDSNEAEKFYRESLAMNRKLLGEKHPEIANGLENVAMTVQDKGDLAGAETLYRQSLSMERELLGPEHPKVGRTLLNLASLQYDRGETGEALANLREVLGIYRKAYPPDHPETARVLNVIGSWLTMGGEDTEADVYLEEGLAMRRRLLNDQHPDVASSLIALAILRVDQKKYTEALDFARNAKAIYTATLSADHWRTALAECAEGAALTGLHRYPEAEKPLTHGHAILVKDSGLPLIYRTLAQRYFDVLHRQEKMQVADATKQNTASP
jgi:tetratricopeptide (TPR) repeat protein